MRLSRALLLALCGSLAGCQAMMYGTAARLNDLRLGMTKAEVIEAVGRPSSTSRTEAEEVLHYRWMRAVIAWWPDPYFVRLVNDRVTEFGAGEK